MRQSITYSVTYHIGYLALGLLLIWSKGMPEDTQVFVFSNLLYSSIGLVVHAMLFFAAYSILKQNFLGIWGAMLLMTLVVLNLFNYPFTHGFATLELFLGRSGEYYGSHLLAIVSVSMAVLLVKWIKQQA